MMCAPCRTGGGPGDRQLHLRFLETPREVLDDGQGRAGGLRLEENELVSSPSGQRAVGTGRMNYLEVGFRGRCMCAAVLAVCACSPRHEDAHVGPPAYGHTGAEMGQHALGMASRNQAPLYSKLCQACRPGAPGSQVTSICAVGVATSCATHPMVAGGGCYLLAILVPTLPKSPHNPERGCVQADLVLASIGYRCLPMPGVAFDEATGTIANRCAVASHRRPLPSPLAGAGGVQSRWDAAQVGCAAASGA